MPKIFVLAFVLASIGSSPIPPDINGILNSAPTAIAATYKCADMVQAVNGLRQLGKLEALRVIREWSISQSVALRDDAKIHMICRLLFVNPQGWNVPKLGRPHPDIRDSAMKECPIFPIVLFEGTPFLVIDGYELGGAPEPGYVSLDKCADLEMISADLPDRGFAKAAEHFVHSDLFNHLYSNSARTWNMSNTIRLCLTDQKFGAC